MAHPAVAHLPPTHRPPCPLSPTTHLAPPLSVPLTPLLLPPVAWALPCLHSTGVTDALERHYLKKLFFGISRDAEGKDLLEEVGAGKAGWLGSGCICSWVLRLTSACLAMGR